MPASDAQIWSDDDFLIVNRRIRVPVSEFKFSYMRSSGPGGQHVNKVSTKVRLRWAVLDSPSLSEALKKRFQEMHRRKITARGEILITSQRYRNRFRNVEDCQDKLQEMLAEAAVAPKTRKKTKPTKTARERRLKQKREQAAKKQRRRPPKLDE